MTMFVIFTTLFFLLFTSVPIAMAIGLAVIAGVLHSGAVPLLLVAQNCFTAIDSFPLMGVPFFMLAGTLMVQGGAARRLINLARALMGWITGGMGIVTVLSCMFFGAISGSGPGTTVAIGSIMVPAMIEGGYKRGLASAIAASAGGTMGIIIPPSIPFIIYAVVARVSIADMFMAGILPGILLAVGLMIACYIGARRTKDNMSFSDVTRFDLKSVWRAFNDAKWALLAPVLILGGIYSGIFTPTESAVVTCIYAIIIGVFVYRELNFKSFVRALTDAGLISGTVLIINGISASFGQFLTIKRIPDQVASAIIGFSDNPVVVLFLIVVVLMIVGTSFEALSTIIILTPIFLPIVTRMGVDPIHFGIIMCVAMAASFVTPPMGTTIFIASQLADTTLEETLRHIGPFLISMMIVLLVVTYVPWLSLAIPQFLAR